METVPRCYNYKYSVQQACAYLTKPESLGKSNDKLFNRRCRSLPGDLDKLVKNCRTANYFGFDDAGNYCSPLVYRSDSIKQLQNVLVVTKHRRTSFDDVHSHSASYESSMSNGTSAEAEGIWDHVTLDPDELSFRAGDHINVKDLSDKDWWWGKIGDREGWFPSSFIRLCTNQIIEDTVQSSDTGRIIMKQSGKSENTARSNVIDEIFSAEREYVKHLRDVVQGYIQPIRQNKTLFSEEQVSVIFVNIEEIYEFSKDLMSCMEQSYDSSNPSDSHIGLCFIKNAEKFKIYSEYCNFHPRASEVLQRLYRNKKYRHFFEGCRLLQDMVEIPLEGFLLTPIQKICKYPLQLAELIKYTEEDHGDYRNLIKAVEIMGNTANLINTHKRKMENIEKISRWQQSVEDWQGADLLDKSSELIHSGLVYKINPNGWWQQRYIFLFDHQLVYCKKELLKKNTFVYRGRIELDNCELIPLDNGRHPLSNSSIRHAWNIFEKERKRSFLMCAKSAADKQRWLQAFRDERELVINDLKNDIHVSNEWKSPYRLSKVTSKLEKPKGKSGQGKHLTNNRVHRDISLSTL